MLKKIMMMLLSAMSLPALASVNLQTGSWIWTVALEGMDIHFNSRSLHQGWWGQGWCSELDQTLTRTSEKVFSFTRCGVKENPLKMIQKDGMTTVFFANSRSVFDENLRLKSSHGAGRNLIVEKRMSSRVSLSLNGKPLILILNEDSPVQKVIQAQSILLTVGFTYSKNLLTQVRSELRTEEYIYDKLDNMIQIHLKQGDVRKNAHISYSADDRVTEVRSSDQACFTRYGYSEFVESAAIYFYSKINRHCDGRLSSPESKTILSRFDRVNGETSKTAELKLSDTREVTL